MGLENWENTLNQIYRNYKNQCKKINREIEKLKNMEITIRTFELRYNDETNKLQKREKSI